MPKTAAALIVGNEILTGKVQEENLHRLASWLFGVGIRLGRVVVCPDDLPTIVDDVRTLSDGNDYVFTSGGIGVTHDDLTVHAVARAFNRQLCRNERLACLLRAHFGSGITERQLQMALVPEGSRLVGRGDAHWPVVALDNVYILPGVPALFRQKLELLGDEVRGDTPFITRAIYLSVDETDIAETLERVALLHPDVAMGSYIRWGDSTRKVKLTIDGTQPAAVDEAFASLVAALPRGAIVEPPES